MEFLDAAGIDLDLFSPRTQRALVTLDEPFSSSLINSSTDSFQLFETHSDYEHDNEFLVAFEDNHCTPKRKSRKQAKPHRVKLNKTLVCSACDQVKDVDPVLVNFVCSKVFHLSCGEAIGTAFCCKVSKMLPDKVNEQRKQIDWLTKIN